jgi:23S rRNA (uridine2552-2'-O)-methyltransferase
LPKTWLKKHRRDYYYRKAKEEKYRSRAAYKLMQVVRKYRFIKPNDIVVDLGAAPGGWMQVASKVVGEQGVVLGIDLKEIEPLDEANVCAIVGDVTNPELTNQIKSILPRSADAVISDVAPNLTGVWDLDHARQIDLARRSLQIVLVILKPEGNFFVKTFQGDLLRDFIKEIKHHFSRVEIIKPPASRARSAEIYILGLHLKAQ